MGFLGGIQWQVKSKHVLLGLSKNLDAFSAWRGVNRNMATLDLGTYIAA